MSSLRSTSRLVLNATDLAIFHRLRIPDDLLIRAGIRRESDEEARMDFGIRGSRSKDMRGVAARTTRRTGTG